MPPAADAHRHGAGPQHPDLPSDALAMRKILKSMGVQEHEPRVINALLDFMYKYTAEVLLDAEAYSEHGGRPGEVDAEDVLMAIQTRARHAFLPQPSQEVLNEVADSINSKPLPSVPEKVYGLRLPRDHDLLSQPGWQVDLSALQPPPPEQPPKH